MTYKKIKPINEAEHLLSGFCCLCVRDHDMISTESPHDSYYIYVQYLEGIWTCMALTLTGFKALLSSHMLTAELEFY